MKVHFLGVKKGRSEDEISFDSFEKGRTISPVEEIDLTLSLPKKEKI